MGIVMNDEVKAFTTIQALIITIILLLISLYFSYRTYDLSHVNWVEIPADEIGVTNDLKNSKDIKNLIDQKINAITKDNTPLPGGTAKLLNLRTANNKEVELKVVEGSFREDTIDPKTIWEKELIGNGFLVNSVDEKGSIGAGINRSISSGCKLEEYESLVQLGELKLLPCTGKYNSDFGIKWVGNASVVIFKGYGERQPCIYVLDDLNENKYSDCIAQAIDDSLKRLFSLLRNNPQVKPDSIVLPALGTGIGTATKRTFYQAFKNVLLRELNFEDSKNVLPQKIILQVWRGNNKEESNWIATKTEISLAIYEIHDEWQRQEHKSGDISGMTGLIGISGTLLAVVLLLILKVPFPKIFRTEYNLLINKPLALVIIGWFLAALGLYTVLVQFTGQVTEFLKNSILAQIFCGVIAVLLCGAIRRAIETFKPELTQTKNV
jgi:hypothetical protein